MFFEKVEKKLKSIISVFNEAISPRKEIEGTVNYYRSKTFNTFVLIALIITIINLVFRIILFLISNSISGQYIILTAGIVLILVLSLLIIGHSKYYYLGFYLLPIIPLLYIWTFYPEYTLNLSIELTIINPTIILILGIIVAGLLFSIKELFVFSILTYIDLILFYGSVTRLMLSWLIPRSLAMILVVSFMLIFTHFRMLSFRYLNETNRKLSNDVEIKHNSLVEEREIFYSLTGNLQEGIIVLDSNSNVLLYNQKFSTFFEFLTGQKLNSSINFKNMLKQKNKFSTFYSIAKSNNEYTEIIDKDFRFFQLKSNNQKIRSDKESGMILEIHEVTDLKKVEILEKNFRQVIMHELRTPATAIQLSISNLTKYWDKLTETDREKLLTTLDNQSSVFSEIIKKISTLTYLEQQKGLSFYNIELEAFIDELETQISLKIIPQAFTLTNNISSNPILFIDKNLILLAIDNILDNSIKFSDENSKIQIILSQNDSNQINIEIIDFGMGISEEELNFVSNRFYKGKNAENIIGNGLGLSIAKEIMELHGGKMRIESEESKGTKITLILKIK